MTAELTPLQVDLNADLGEGAPHDAALLALVSSINVACGWHASDARLMQRTVTMAVAHGVAIGAHPSFFDRENFGRTEMQVALADVRADMLYQIGALDAMVRAAGSRMQHVKPHGAIYNQAARDPALAETIVAAVRDFDPSLIIYGLAGGELLKAAERAGLRTVSEVFADRGYRADGSLVPRTEPGAYIETPEGAAARVLRAVREGVMEAVSGELLPLRAQTICLHGDGPRALPFAQAIHGALREAGVTMRL